MKTSDLTVKSSIFHWTLIFVYFLRLFSGNHDERLKLYFCETWREKKYFSHFSPIFLSARFEKHVQVLLSVYYCLADSKFCNFFKDFLIQCSYHSAFTADNKNVSNVKHEKLVNSQTLFTRRKLFSELAQIFTLFHLNLWKPDKQKIKRSYFYWNFLYFLRDSFTIFHSRKNLFLFIFYFSFNFFRIFYSNLL